MRSPQFGLALLAGVISFPLVQVAASTDFDQWFQSLQSHGVTTPAQAIALLPEEMKHDYSLVYKSVSLQPASEDSPRAALFGHGGKFVVSFSDSSAGVGEGALEVLQFDDQKARFELFDLDFPLKRDEKGSIVRPESNPAICVTCHLSDPRPIFGIFPTWSGVYGSDRDQLTPEERPGFQSFLQHARQSQLYGQLSIPANPKPNLRLTQALSDLNAQRVLRKLKEAKVDSRHSTVLLYLLQGCDSQQSLEVLLGRPAFDRLAASVKRVWWIEYGLSPLNNGSWVSAHDFLGGVFRVQNDDVSIQLVGTVCQDTQCMSNKTDGVRSMRDRVVALMGQAAGDSLSCTKLAASMQRGWSKP